VAIVSNVARDNMADAMITGLTHQTEEIEQACQQAGAAGFLQKPLEI